MLVLHDNNFDSGYTAITELDGMHANMLMDFGILQLEKNSKFKTKEAKECAYLLLDGTIEFECQSIKQTVSRNSLLDDPPFCLHVASETNILIHAKTNAELAVQKTLNNNKFATVLYSPDTIRNQKFGEGTMQDTSTRIVRTVFDASNAPYSNMVIGEVINFAGKWSSYPPHAHPQPEVYHYRFPTAPRSGFGFGEVGDKVYKLTHQSSLMIEPWVVHPQCAAPGYPMYYIWMIPHLKDAKFGPDSRQFLKEHEWLLDSKAKIWPN